MRLRQLPVLLLVGVVFTFGVGESAIAKEGHSSWINPFWENLIDHIPLPPEEAPRQERTSQTCYSYTEFKEALKSELQDRNTSFSIRIVYDFTWSEVGSIVDRAFDEIKIEDGYTGGNVYGRNTGWSGGDGDTTITFSWTYVTTYAEEQEVTQRVAEIIADIISPDMNDEDKVKAIHDWVVLNVEYDQTSERHSAHDALFGVQEAVCQGYALLIIRMLQDVGIEAKYVSNEDHAWNLVYLCGHWYHLDATWDDPSNMPPDYLSHTYYLLSDSEISMSRTFDPSAYPDAPDSYVEGICDDVTTPDLAIQSPGASPSSLNPGESLTASCTIVNQGDGTAGASTIKYYLSSDGQYDTGDTYLGYGNIDSINSGWTVSPSRSLTIPSSTASGTWYLLFKADANNTVDESDESNNTASVQISVISDTLTWLTSRAEAVSAAQAQGKTILLLAGRETCYNTTQMRDTVCQKDDPPIRNTIENHYIPWFCDVDNSTEWYSYASGLESFTLPLICRIDPDNPDTYIDRTTGMQDADVFYNRLIDCLFVIKGDLNSNAKLDLGDAILALQVCAGVNVSVQLAADVNDDNRIGMEEAIYVLNMLSRGSTYADGFESGDFSHLSWLRSRSAPSGTWTVTDEYPGSGWYAAQSAHEQSVNNLVLETTLDCVDGQVQYEFAIGMEDNPFGDPVSMFEGFPSDVRLKFYVDDQIKMEWSHIVGYTSRSHSVSPGRHSLKWVSENTLSSAQQAVWLDNVVVK
jgi:transglutaminase-like putative cysteine protease